MKNPTSQLVIVLPSLNPAERIIDLVKELRCNCSYSILIVNDGSDKEKNCIFDELSAVKNCTVITHAKNLGKGRALKSAFNYAITHHPRLIGTVTADGDGQHTAKDIIRCAETLLVNPKKLILGVRDFKQDIVPWKSKLGNLLTAGIFRWLLGMKITDTQTGLRGIPIDFMKHILDKYGERFEYETVMLVESKYSSTSIEQVVIETVYINDNRESHFRPIVDSIKIYRIVLKAIIDRIFLFGCSGILSTVFAQAVFALLYYKLLPSIGIPPLIFAVAIARSISLLFNYLFNLNIVFNSGNKLYNRKSFAKYLLLCVFITLCSYGLLKATNLLWPQINVLLLKIIIDSLLFILSYQLQKSIVFKLNQTDRPT